MLVIYATGLGAVARQGSLSMTTTPVTVVLNGTELPILYCGADAGISGLVSGERRHSGGDAPGFGISLTLKQGEQLSNVVPVAVQ